jgi:small GTP-binding protein
MTSFDIRVALLGYVSAGKSTVLNALLQGKHSAVGKRRSTAGVNFFRVHTKEKTAGAGDAAIEDSLKTAVSPVAVNGSRPRDAINTVQSANETLEAIERDNAQLRESGALKESTFDVVLDEPLCEMRSDTKLVLIDVPGLNEAGSNDLYRTYVNAKWDTFDCVLTIVDVYQGVNTEEQVRLLELIKDNLRLRKNIPIIVLCNKVDDPEDEEVSDLVDEVRKKVEEIFTDGGLDQSATSGEVSLSSLLTRCVQSSAVVSAPGKQSSSSRFQCGND